jgi:hypothetical protein
MVSMWARCCKGMLIMQHSNDIILTSSFVSFSMKVMFLQSLSTVDRMPCESTNQCLTWSPGEYLRESAHREMTSGGISSSCRVTVAMPSRILVMRPTAP